MARGTAPTVQREKYTISSTPSWCIIAEFDGFAPLVSTVELEPPSCVPLMGELVAAMEAKATKKAAAAEAERLKRIAKLERGRTPPSEMFKPPHVPDGTYGSYDDAGMELD